MEKLLSIASLKELLTYDPETGIFKNRIGRMGRALAGAEAGYRMPVGYTSIFVAGKRYYGHRLAFAFQMGRWPSPGVDHINGDKGDNRWANLREADQRLNGQNQRKALKNSKSGILGVHPYRGKWRAQITRDRVPISLGIFESISDANAAYQAAKPVYHHESVQERS